jgi:glycerate 2-kinase
MKEIARHIFDHAMRESGIARAFSRHIHCERGVLRICEDLYDLNSYNRVLAISIGKAAHSMLTALHEQTGERFEGIVASPLAPEFHIRGFRYFQGGHPLPTEESMRAADAILKSLSAQNEASLVVYLISGGGSATVEKPIDEEISLPDVIETYRVLVHSGASISEINTVRKHLSAVKGGRLAQAAYPARQVSVLISDVPDDRPDALASGPTMPDSTTMADCYTIATKYKMLEQFPKSVHELFECRALEETPKSDDPAFVHARWWTILSNAALLEAAGKEATRQGFLTEFDNSCDDWDYAKAADHLLDRLRELRRMHDRVCLLSGGEVTVQVQNGGIGGRNQQFALYCASKITGENICVLSVGSDGIDGDSTAAGAIVDGSTSQRAKVRGLDVASNLSTFNAYPLFEALGDAIVTGPTGNNLRDLRILLAY